MWIPVLVIAPLITAAVSMPSEASPIPVEETRVVGFMTIEAMSGLDSVSNRRVGRTPDGMHLVVVYIQMQCPEEKRFAMPASEVTLIDSALAEYKPMEPTFPAFKLEPPENAFDWDCDPQACSWPHANIAFLTPKKATPKTLRIRTQTFDLTNPDVAKGRGQVRKRLECDGMLSTRDRAWAE